MPRQKPSEDRKTVEDAAVLRLSEIYMKADCETGVHPRVRYSVDDKTVLSIVKRGDTVATVTDKGTILCPWISVRWARPAE